MSKESSTLVETSSNGAHASEASGQQQMLIEVAWEVANQVGGIYTVIRSKVTSIQEHWGGRYCLLGPLVHPNVMALFEPGEPPENAIGRAVRKLRENGLEVHYGTWLIQGRPKVVLFNPFSIYHRLGEIKYALWDHHDITISGDEELLNQVVAFGFMVQEFLAYLGHHESKHLQVVAHFHEWMAGTAIPGLRRAQVPVQTVFTTHATMLGRYLAMNSPDFYGHLPYFDWQAEAKNFNIESQVRIERAAAHGAHVFTTVSDVTATECVYLIGRQPDMVLPNGFNIQRFSVSHEVQNLHQENKDHIHQFTRGHFFPCYPFSLDRTLYFFTSGRFEYKNKGYDLTLEALARLNWRMKQANIDRTVVMFFITQRPVSSINPEVLQARATLDKIENITEEVTKQVGQRLFLEAIAGDEHTFPDLNDMVDDYWKLRLRRTLQIWKSHGLPKLVTHNLYDDGEDEILGFLRRANMLNFREDKVKIVYHPDFLNVTSPLLGLDYPDFVRGCHLGIFPSYYEPWGYTPLECMAAGVPAVTSDLAGFGDFVINHVEDPETQGIYVVRRREAGFEDAANQLADLLFSFVQLSRSDRISYRYRVEKAAELFDWKNLVDYYNRAYHLAFGNS